MGHGAEKRKRDRFVRSPSPSMASTGTSSRKRKRRASVFPHIPDELMRDILLCLPSKSLLRFRAVCKSWRRLASDSEFLLEHHRRQPPLPLISLLRDSKEEREPKLVACCVDAFDLRTDEFRPVVRYTTTESSCRGIAILGSCDGLLLVSFDRRLYVCNPATHQWTRLPTPSYYSKFVGFYAHGPSEEYRGLTSYLNWPWTQYSITAAGSGEVRCIGLLPSVEEGYEFQTPTWSELPVPALIRGSLHRPPQECDDHKILAFDTVAEVFWWMRPPPVTRENISRLEMEGELAMFSCCKEVSMVELWLLQDYENQDWVCKYRIELPEPGIDTFRLEFDGCRPFFMSEEEVVLVNPQQRLLCYDTNGNLRGDFCCGGRYVQITHLTLKENLVQHAFFQIQDNDSADDEPPPFFQGL